MVKNKIRKSLLKQGQLFCQDDIKELNSQIQKNVLKEIDIESSKNTLLYFQYKNEIPTNLIIDELLKYSNNIYMPRIVSENEMKFNLFKEGETLKTQVRSNLKAYLKIVIFQTYKKYFLDRNLPIPYF